MLKKVISTITVFLCLFTTTNAQTPHIEYYGTGGFMENIDSSYNDGSVLGNCTAGLIGDVFQSNLVEGVHYKIHNKPAGLITSMTAYQQNGYNFAVLEFTGHALVHGDSNDVYDMKLEWLDGAFVNTPIAQNVSGYVKDSFVVNFFGPTIIRAFVLIQGYFEWYDPFYGEMKNVLYNQGILVSPNLFWASMISDSVILELHATTTPYQIISSKKVALCFGGHILEGFDVSVDSSYVVVKSRSGLETWSAHPVNFQLQEVWGARWDSSQAYGNNQFFLGNGTWAIYSGDINQDGSIDSFDYLLLDSDITSGASGYLSTDLTGDGTVDVFDYLVLAPNIANGISVAKP